MEDQFTRDLTNIWKEDKWLYFELVKEKPKTKVFNVISKCSGMRLGLIMWYPRWRHYCFFPTVEEATVHSDRCLLSISSFITELNEKHKTLRVVE